MNSPEQHKPVLPEGEEDQDKAYIEVLEEAIKMWRWIAYHFVARNPNGVRTVVRRSKGEVAFLIGCWLVGDDLDWGDEDGLE